MNKKITEEVAEIQSKRLRNKIAGFTTHLMKRIQKGPVRGISLKLQEEERERRMEYVPDRSEVRRCARVCEPRFDAIQNLSVTLLTRPSIPQRRLERFALKISLALHLNVTGDVAIVNACFRLWQVDTDTIHVDADTKAMLRELDMDKLPNIVVTNAPLIGGARRR